MFNKCVQVLRSVANASPRDVVLSSQGVNGKVRRRWSGALAHRVGCGESYTRDSIPWPRHEIGTFKSRCELRHEDIVPACAHQRPVAKVDRAIKSASQQRVAELVEGDAHSSLVGGSIAKTLAP